MAIVDMVVKVRGMLSNTADAIWKGRPGFFKPYAPLQKILVKGQTFKPAMRQSGIVSTAAVGPAKKISSYGSVP